MTSFRSLGFSSYEEYLSSSHWQEITRSLIDLNPRARCWICGKRRHLLLHHVSYDHLGHERLGIDIYIVCYGCHEEIHWSVFLCKRIPIEKSTMMSRMYLLRVTYPLRKFRLGSAINNFFRWWMTPDVWCRKSDIVRHDLFSHFLPQIPLFPIPFFMCYA